MEGSTIASAGRPPIVCRVDHGVSTGPGVICVDEVADPSDHGGVAEPVAGRTRRVVLDVEHAGKCSAVGAPSTSMFEKEVGLRRAGAGIWVGKMISAPDQLGIGCADIMT